MHRCLPPARDPGFSRCFSLSQQQFALSARHTADIWRSSRFRLRGWELVPPPSSLASPLLCFSCWESASHGTGAAAGRRRRKVPLFYRRFCAATWANPRFRDESMKLLSQRLDRFITLCHAVTNSEDSLVKRSEQISALMAKQNDCSLVIEEQQRVQWELEKSWSTYPPAKTGQRRSNTF